MTEPGKTFWLKVSQQTQDWVRGWLQGFLLAHVLLVGHFLCSQSFLDHKLAFIRSSTAVKIWLLLSKKGFRSERRVLHFNRLLLAVLLGQDERKKRGRRGEWGSSGSSAKLRWQVSGAWEQWEQCKAVWILDISLNTQGFGWEHLEICTGRWSQRNTDGIISASEQFLRGWGLSTSDSSPTNVTVRT